MAEKKLAPGIFIDKGMDEVMEMLNEKDRLNLMDAILKYSKDRPLPEMSYTVAPLFEMCRQRIDYNEKRYKQRCKWNKAYQAKQKEVQSAPPAEPSEAEAEEKPKARGKPAREPTAEKTATGEVIQGELTPEQTRFLASFKTHCPDKVINCKLADFPNIDLNALMIAIKKSPQFLMVKNQNETLNGLQWYLKNADKIISDSYIKYGDEKPKPEGVRHNYTKEECNALFQNVDEIEV